MKIMWIANLPLPEMADRVGINSPLGGWLTALSNRLKTMDDIEFIYCFPQARTKSLIQKRIDKVMFYGFYENGTPRESGIRLENVFKRIYLKERPDVVHIFGSEYYHAYAAVRSGIDLDRMVLSIQGIMKIYASHYCKGISLKDRWFPCIDGKRKIGCIENDRKNFEAQGQYEDFLFKHMKFFEGRTDFDRAYVKVKNPSGKCFSCNHILREKFYEGQWSAQQCEPFSIFVSQASYPVKGLHIFLQAFHMLRKLLPGVKVYIGGQKICIGKNSSPYGKYIERMIQRYHLEKQICFLGPLNEEKMHEQYLKSNVFVIPSVIENSPYSLSEAMMLGVPCIAADVGGVSSMMEHAKEGFIYRVDEPHMLTYYLYELMNDRKLAQTFSENARRRALKDYDAEENTRKVIAMYKYMIEQNKVQ